jgi:integrase
MAKRLTDITIRNLKPRPTRYELPGGDGLYVIVQPVTGKRSFAARYRRNGRPAKLTLGQWPAMTLADARVAATKARERVKQGEDPAKARQDAKIKADAAKANTLTAVCENYLKREGAKLRTLDQRTSILRRLIYPHIGSRPVAEIKRSEIVDLLDKVEDGHGARAADVCLAVLRKIMNWYATRADDFVPPFVRGMARQNAKDHRRTRVLTNAEIRKLWAATADGQPFSALIRFALLTSARRGEIAGMKRSEVVDGVWRLPASRSKTKVEVVRPLSKAALTLIEQMPRIDGCDFIFTSNGVTPINSFSGPKRLLDAASGVRDWRLHDLRRSARSLLSRAGVNSDVAEKCLGHSRGGVVETYDLHKYLDEMQRAFEALSALVARIVNPPEGEVADLATERKRRR